MTSVEIFRYRLQSCNEKETLLVALHECNSEIVKQSQGSSLQGGCSLYGYVEVPNCASPDLVEVRDLLEMKLACCTDDRFNESLYNRLVKSRAYLRYRKHRESLRQKLIDLHKVNNNIDMVKHTYTAKNLTPLQFYSWKVTYAFRDQSFLYNLTKETSSDK